jgi:hypothetical protein
MLHGEPPLQDLLSEPIIRLLAQSYGVSHDELVRLCEETRTRLMRTTTPHQNSGSSLRTALR